MNPRTESYLRRYGLPEGTIEALKAGGQAVIDAGALTGWLRAAFESGLAHRRAAVQAEIERLDQYWAARGRGVEAANELLTARLRRLENLEAHWREHHEIVADVQQWFFGFAAAHAGREPWERPRVPDPRRLRDLNLALLSVDPSPQPEKVPF